MGKMLKYGRVVGAGVALAAVAAVGIGAATALNPASAPEPTPTAVVETVDFGAIPYTNGLASEQEAEAAAVVAEQARVAAEQAAAAEAARVAAEQAAAVQAEQVAADSEPEPPSDSGPTLCPSGTVAQAVDDFGNESNCAELSTGGEQCVAYNDANECTAWLKP